jgi:glycerophosphoryl diester phosphodiesterase
MSFPLFAFDIIAHRGLPRLYPEHSMQSLKEAMKFEPQYVEPDVVLSKDGVAFVLHDTHIDTTTNVAKVFPDRKRKDGRYYAIDFTAIELKKLNINHRIELKSGKPAFATRPLLKKSNLRIPTLEQFLVSVANHNKKHKKKIGVYPEIKAPRFHEKENKDIVKIVHDQLLAFHKKYPETPIILQCFDFKSIKRLATELKSPFFLVQLVAENSWKESDTDYDWLKTKNGLKEVRKYAKGLGPWIPQIVTPDKKPTSFLKEAKKLGFKIHPYTLRNDALPKVIGSEEELLKLLIKDLKVDGIFTDNVNTTVGLSKSILKE